MGICDSKKVGKFILTKDDRTADALVDMGCNLINYDDHEGVYTLTNTIDSTRMSQFEDKGSLKYTTTSLLCF